MLWLTVVEWPARLILVTLIGLSIWSVTIMIDRRRYFKGLTLPGADLKEAIQRKNSQPQLTFIQIYLLS